MKKIDVQKTVELIERLKLARVGEYKKWESILKKINSKEGINQEEYNYIANLSRTYKDGNVAKRTKTYHTRLSNLDEKPPCKTCGDKSAFYCNMNDEYFCTIHVVGHDRNEV